MPRKTKKERQIERIKLLLDIKFGRKHTHRNDILAPLSQADIVRYDSTPPTYRATNVRLTESGEIYIEIMAKELGIPVE